MHRCRNVDSGKRLMGRPDAGSFLDVATLTDQHRASHPGCSVYRLNHPPDKITLERIVRIFQGPLAPIACATRNEPEPCPMEISCSLRETWAEVRDATIAILERTDFATLAQRAGGPWVAFRREPRERTSSRSG